MKRFCFVVFLVLMYTVLTVGVHCANPTGYDLADNLGIRDSRIREFVTEGMLKNEDKFVYEEKCKSLDDRFNNEHNIYKMTLPEARSVRAAEVNKLLQEGKEVNYSDSFLSDWAFCELRKRGVPCEELTISCGASFRRVAVLIPQVVAGDIRWYVCDLSEISRYNSAPQGGFGYRRFMFCPLKNYLGLYGSEFRGAIVNDEDYSCYGGMSVVGGRDVFCWLSQNGHSAYTAVDILSGMRTGRVKLMDDVDHEERDHRRFNFLKKLAGLD